MLCCNGKIFYLLCLLFALTFNQIAGESRGFAFVAFATIDEARRWLEKKQVETRSSSNNNDDARRTNAAI